MQATPTGYEYSTHAQECDVIDVGNIIPPRLSVVLAKTLADITRMVRLICCVKQNNRWSLAAFQVEFRYLSQLNICLSRRPVLLSCRNQIAGLGCNQSVSYRMQSLVPVYFSRTHLFKFDSRESIQTYYKQKKNRSKYLQLSRVTHTSMEWL